MRFGNAAVEGGRRPPDHYTLHWFAFDNATDTRRTVGERPGDRPEGMAPPGLLAGGDFVAW